MYPKQSSLRAHVVDQFGGDGRDRTDDLKLAKLPLSQLSYVPLKPSNPTKAKAFKDCAGQRVEHQTWWAWVDSNYRPHAYQACALTGLSYRPLSRTYKIRATRIRINEKEKRRRRRLAYKFAVS